VRALNDREGWRKISYRLDGAPESGNFAAYFYSRLRGFEPEETFMTFCEKTTVVFVKVFFRNIRRGTELRADNMTKKVILCPRLNRMAGYSHGHALLLKILRQHDRAFFVVPFGIF
jgi:hypothetical protein